MFELNVECINDHTCIMAVKGEIDIYSAPVFKENLSNAVGEGKRDIILECIDLSYIDSMGLGVLVGALKRVRESEHNIVIRNPRATIRKLFKITGLDKVFIIEEAKS
jgi:anti-sigma B factor antagonist